MQRVNTQILTTALLSFVLAVSTQAGFKTFRGTVTKIVDGDTINFLANDAEEGAKPWSIRMITTDTPETHLPGLGGPFSQGIWGEEAHQQLESILKIGETVEVDNYGTDHYGRVLGRVFKRGNVDVNLAMLKSGWAALYLICDVNSCDDQPKYREACDVAMDKGIGIFNPHHRLPQMPFIFRSIKQNRPLAKFVGNVRTKKFYEPSQYSRIPVCDRTFFMTKTDATGQGYVPANAN